MCSEILKSCCKVEFIHKDYNTLDIVMISFSFQNDIFTKNKVV